MDHCETDHYEDPLLNEGLRRKGCHRYIAPSLFGLVFVIAVVGIWQAVLVSRIVDNLVEGDAAASSISQNISTLTLQCRRYEKDIFLNIADEEKREAYYEKWLKSWHELGEAIHELEILTEGTTDEMLAATLQQYELKYANEIENIYSDILAGNITTPAEANAAMMPYKNTIRHITDTTNTLADHLMASAQESGKRLQRYSHWQLALTGPLVLIPAVLVMLSYRQVHRRFRRSIIDLSHRTRQLERAQAELSAHARELRQLADTDQLTGLPNRIALRRALTRTMEQAKRSGTAYAVLFMDFDRFKLINDSLGHDVGDQLLLAIGDRLRKVTKHLTGIDADRRLMPARIGGDEFVVLCRGIQDPDEANVISAALQEELSSPYMLDGHEVRSTPSIGIAFGNENHKKPEDVLRDADTAMYEAKNNGGDRTIIFDQHMHDQLHDQMQIEQDLRKLLSSEPGEQMRVVYQPIVNLATGQPVGMEALCRWPHPTLGVINPAKFIPIAEETGLIRSLDRYVLATACQQYKTWQSRGINGSKLWLNVNLSRQALDDIHISDEMYKIVTDHGLAPESIYVELTEGVIMRNPKSAASCIAHLREAGFKLAIDDFGTAYSSLSCLHDFPFDRLKIDRSFMHEEIVSREHTAVIDAIITLAHNLNMDVVAEGIEHVDQIAQLLSMDCDLAQGFYYAKPLETDQVKQYLLHQSNVSLQIPDNVAPLDRSA